MRFVALFLILLALPFSTKAACPYADVYFQKGMTKQALDELEGCAAGFYDVESMNQLATIYYLGKGTSVDFTKALRYFQMAASTGYAPSQVKLALMYWRGEGTSKDLKKAYMWLYAASGSPESRWYLPAGDVPGNKDANAETYMGQIAKQISEVDRRDAIIQIEEHFKKPHLFATAEEVRGILGAEQFEADFDASSNDARRRTQLLSDLRKEYITYKSLLKLK